MRVNKLTEVSDKAREEMGQEMRVSERSSGVPEEGLTQAKRRKGERVKGRDGEGEVIRQKKWRER